MRPHLEIYQDKADGWSWRKVAGNGEVTAHGESYTRKADALEAVDREFPGVEVLVIEVSDLEPVVPPPVPPPEDDAA